MIVQIAPPKPNLRFWIEVAAVYCAIVIIGGAWVMFSASDDHEEPL